MTRIQKIRKLATAVHHMERAIALLNEVATDPSNSYFLTADAGHYREELSELLSCDHGEAGLKVFADILTKKVEDGYFQ